MTKLYTPFKDAINTLNLLKRVPSILRGKALTLFVSSFVFLLGMAPAENFAQSISVTSVATTPVCAGSDVTITFDVTNGIGAANYFTTSTDYQIYLSDASGTVFTAEGPTFNNSTQTYDVTDGGTTSGLTQTFTIPAGTASGAGYEISIGSTSPTFDASAGAGASAAFTIDPDATIILTSGAGTDAQTVCDNTAITDITYSVGGGGTGAGVTGLPAGVTGSFSGGVFTISGTATATGTFTYTITTTGTCAQTTAIGTITVTPNNTITLTSAAGTTAQTVCINTPITNITYSTTGATGATVTNLPTGVTGTWAANVVTISGTPTVAGAALTYTVTLTGGCGVITTTGTIAVTANNTVTRTSAAATTAQTVCINTPITNITYSTTGATGATVTNLPTGVTGTWAANVVTISGTPTVAGAALTYTVTLTGGCGVITTTGTIAVTANNTVTRTSAAATTAQTVCINTPITNITYSTTGATGATVTNLPTGVTGTWAANVVTISGTPTVAGAALTYTVTLTGGCGVITTTGTIAVTANNTVNRTSAVGTDAQTVCINTPITNITYSTTGATGATVTNLPTGVTGTWAANVVTISGTPTVAGAARTYTVTLTGGCGVITTTGTITVTANNTVTRTSAAATTAQTVCINTPITNITYSTTGATGATVTNLPTGVTGTWAANVVTISGTPTVAGAALTYTVTLTGGCGVITTTGTIAVTANNTVNRTSAVGTDAQTVCINTPITNITYSTTGATGATVTNLPTGVTGTWAANVVTISGTPTVAGAARTYTVTLTGGCGVITTTGTITVTANNTVTRTSAAATTAQTVCINTPITNITYSTTGATGATVTNLPTGVTGTWAANVVTISGTPTVAGAALTYTVTLTGGCGLITTTGTIAVTANNTVTRTSAAATTAQTVCINTPITNITYSTTGATGATVTNLPTGVTGTWAANVVTISGTPTVAGAALTYTVTLTGGCGVITTTGTIAVTANNTVNRTSAVGTDAQTVCINTPITNITYSTTGATGATVTNLPTGVTGTWAANVVTISGTPTVAGAARTYTVTLTGGCGVITTTGTITVTANNTVTRTSAAATTAQTVCINTPITNITYSTTGATGATVTNLPTGVTGTWAANVVTISGTPTVAGAALTYTVTLTGGCGVITTTGTIAVTANNTVNRTSAVGTDAQTVCINTPITNITYSTTGATGATVTNLPTGVTGTWAANVVTISGTPTVAGAARTYTVTLTGGCGVITTTGTITVTANNTVTRTSAAATTAQTVCINTPITNITYSTTGATGATVTNLPTGVTGTWAANVVTISGTPTVAGAALTYTVTLTGGCGLITTTGTIAVTANNTVNRTSAVGTDAQTVCINTAITNITYSTTGATGATFSGLPPGVTGSWAANVVTISGTPTASGMFNYIVTLTGGCGNITATGSITVNLLPTPTITGANSACINSSGNVYTTESGQTNYTWTINGGTITAGGGNTDNTATVTWTTSGASSISVNYNDANGCSASSATAYPVTVNDLPTIADAGPDQDVCGGSTSLEANTPTTGAGLWTIISGGAGGTITTPTSPTSTFTGTIGTTYTLRWTISNDPCTPSTDDVDILFSNGTTANAGPDQTGAATCGLTTVTLAANTPDIANGENGTWTIVSGAGGSFTDATSPTTDFSGTAGTTYTLKWSISFSTCTSSDNVVIKFNQIPTTADAGPDQTGATTCGSTTVTLAGNAPTVGTGNWSTITGAGGTVNTPTSPTSTFTGIAGNTYTLRWTISNNPCTASTDDVDITFNQNPTTAIAGSTQTICTTGSATLAANNPVIGTAAWSVVSGPSTALTQFSSTTINNATFTPVGGAGSYVLQWAISNAPCTASTSNVTITVTAQPTTSDAGLDQTVCATTATLAGNTPTVGTGTWTRISGAGTVTTPGSPTSGITGLGVGANTFRWTIANAPCISSTDDVIITRSATPTTATVGANQNICGTSATLSGNTPAIGSGLWTLISGTGTITTPTNPTSGVTGLGAGSNVFRWTISNSPCPSTFADLTISATPPLVNDSIQVQSFCRDQTTGIVTMFFGEIPPGMSGGGGSGTYTYKWQISCSGGNSFTDMIPAQTGAALALQQSAQNCFYRRLVTSSSCAEQSKTLKNQDRIHINLSNTFSSIPFSITPSPTAAYCVGGLGVEVKTSGSIAADLTNAFTPYDVRYDLYLNGVYVQSLSGTGNPLNFGYKTTTGLPYTITETIILLTPGASSCSATNLTGSLTLSMDQPPTTSTNGGSQTICSATTATLTGNAPTIGTGAWSVVSGPSTVLTQFSNTSSNTAVFTPAGGAGDYVLAWTISNGACAASASQLTITVNPVATVTAVTNKVVCNNASTTAITFSSPTPLNGGTIVFNWTNNDPSIGLAGTGTGTIASFVATNGGAAPVTATITVTPSYTKNSVTCIGTPSTFTITVNPTATVNAVTNQVVCNASLTTAVTFSSPTTGGSIVYNWTNNTTSIGLAASGSGNIAAFTATNLTGAPVTATITVTPAYTNGTTCTGTPITFTITVNPKATVTAVSNQVLCNGSSSTAVTFSSPTTGGSIVYNWTNSATSIGLAASGTGNIAAFTATNITSAPVVATITVTPSYTNGGTTCTGTPVTFTITVNPTTVSGFLPSVSLCSGATGTVTLTGNVGSVVRWESSPDGITWTNIANTTTSQTYTAVAQTIYYRVLVQSGNCPAVYSNIDTVGLHNVWTGFTSTDWFTASNWSDNQVPTLIPCPTILIPQVAPGKFYPIIPTGTAIVNNIVINANASVIVSGGVSGGIMQIAGTITNNGTFDVTAGTIEFNGAAAQTIPANVFATNKIMNLVISNNVSLNGVDSLTGTLSFGSSSKTFTTNGNLILKSTISGTAAVGQIANGNAITGNVSVERYIATGTVHAKAWELLAVPTQGQTINQAWQEGATQSNVSTAGAVGPGNPVPGYGTMITGYQANALALGFDASTPVGSTVKTYIVGTSTSPAGLGYVGPASTSISLYNKKGYFVFVRGDRSVYTFNGAANPTILRSKGTLFTPANPPPQTTVLAGFFESVGNPYASAIDIRNISFGGGTQQFFIVWDPKLGGSLSLGAFQTLGQTGPIGDLNFYANPGGGSYGSGPVNYIQSGQAFFVQAFGIDGTVDFTESCKANGSALVTLPARINSVQHTLRTTLNTANADGTEGNIVDGVLSQFDDAYSNNIDAMDARKLSNTDENLAIKTSGKLLVIERKQTITQKDTIFLDLTGVRVQQYQFTFDAEYLNTGLEAFLEDSYLHTRTSVNLSGSTVVNFSIENVAGSYAHDRFRIVFAPSAALPLTFTSVKAYRQDKNIDVEWRVENEMNMKQYEVEKSINGTQFTTLVVKAATANEGRSAIYVTSDNKPVEGYNYYRVKSVDINGKTTYSDIVKVLIGSMKRTITIHPNPITDGMIHLQLMNQPEGRYGIRLLNKLGQVIMSRQISHAEGSSTEIIKWNYNLAHGIYQLEITKPDGDVKNIKVMY